MQIDSQIVHELHRIGSGIGAIGAMLGAIVGLLAVKVFSK